MGAQTNDAYPPSPSGRSNALPITPSESIIQLSVHVYNNCFLFKPADLLYAVRSAALMDGLRADDE